MCEFCKNLSYEKDEYKELASTTNNIGILGEMTTSIGVWANDDGTFTMQTMLGGIMSDAEEAEVKISFCPICGRKLCDETETPIEHFLKSEIERSKLRMNAYAECFDGVHVDNDTRKKLLESHIRFCKNALKQCMDV